METENNHPFWKCAMFRQNEKVFKKLRQEDLKKYKAKAVKLIRKGGYYV